MLVLATANLPKAIMTPCALVGAMLVMLLTFIIDKFLTVTERLWVVRPAILSAVLMGSTSFDRIDDAILALIVGTACYFGWIYSDNIRMFIRGLKLS
ncbi:MAG TPA: hypothetical protein VMH91_03375 [Candidatus Paceibacterota bacterium]|nr:hypothetical protein [Candidatus Paceibacterota bacterium]